MMKRSISSGGAGVTAKDTPQAMFQKLCKINDKRAFKDRHLVEKELKQKITYELDGKLLIVSRHCTSLAQSLVSKEWERRSDFCLCYFRNSISCESSTERHILSPINCDDGQVRLVCDCPYSFQYLLPCRHLLSATNDIKEADIHYRWFLRYWRGEFIPKKRLTSYIGSIAPETVLDKMKQSEETHNLSDKGGVDETPKRQHFSIPSTPSVPKFYPEAMRLCSELINAGDMSEIRRKSTMDGLLTLLKKVEAMPFDTPRSALPRHKSWFERV